MDKNQCIKLLQQALNSNPDTSNLSQLSTEVWGKNKTTCVQNI